MTIADLKCGDWFTPIGSNEDIYILAQDGFSYLIQSSNINASKCCMFESGQEVKIKISFQPTHNLIDCYGILLAYEYDQAIEIEDGKIICIRNSNGERRYFITSGENLICFLDSSKYNVAGHIYNVMLKPIGVEKVKSFDIEEINIIKK